MTRYEFLSILKNQGVLKLLYKYYGLPTNLARWMEYYEFYLAHPDLSFRELSYYLPATKSTIERAIAFMQAPHPEVVP